MRKILTDICFEFFNFFLSFPKSLTWWAQKALEDTKTLKTIENKRTKDQSTNQWIQNGE